MGRELIQQDWWLCEMRKRSPSVCVCADEKRLCEDKARRPLSPSQEEGLHWELNLQVPYLEHPASRTVTSLCCSSHSVYDISLWQPELKHILVPRSGVLL